MVGDPNWNDTEIIRRTHKYSHVKTPPIFKQSTDMHKLDITEL